MSRLLKRGFDLIVSLILILVTLPVFCLISILILAFMGRPILFRQSRPGKNEKLFQIYKFRTMSPMKSHQKVGVDDAMRLTPLGKVLRKLSLDELPQLFNILKNEMSFVGPRPLLPEYLELYSDEQKQRHLLKPGITGLAQINGRNNLSWEKRFALDVEYCKNQSFLGDIKILVKTVGIVFSRKGISAPGNFSPVFQGTKTQIQPQGSADAK